MVLVGTIAARRLRPWPQEEGKETTTRERRRVTSVCVDCIETVSHVAPTAVGRVSLCLFFSFVFFPNNPNTRPTLRVPAFQGFVLVPFVSSDGLNTPPIFPRKQHKRKLKNTKLEWRGERSKGGRWVRDGWEHSASLSSPPPSSSPPSHSAHRRVARGLQPLVLFLTRAISASRPTTITTTRKTP